MKKFMSIYVLVALLCATSANAFNFDFNDTKVIEVTPNVSQRIPFWQSSKVEKGDTFSQYCVDFLRTSGLSRHYSQHDCFDSIKAVNEYGESQLHWIYPDQIVWLPSLQNIKLGDVVESGPFVRVEQLRLLLGLDKLEARINALPDEVRVSEMVSKATAGIVDKTLPDLVTNEVNRQLAGGKPTFLVGSGDPPYVSRRVFWLISFLLACLALLAVAINWLRSTSDDTARNTANTAKTTANAAHNKAEESEAKAEKSINKTVELEAVSNRLGDQLRVIDKKVTLAQEAADEAGELAASAMALLRFGDFRVVDGYPTQTAVDKLRPGEKVAVTLSHIDNEEDVRQIHFTCVAGAFNDDREGLKIDGITNQRRPVIKQLRSIATAIANGARSNHLQGVDQKDLKSQQKSRKSV